MNTPRRPENSFGFFHSILRKTQKASSTNPMYTDIIRGFPGGWDGEEPASNTGDPGSIPGLGRSSGDGDGHPLQYSRENPTDRGAWWSIQFMGSQRVRHDWATHTANNFTHIYIYMLIKEISRTICFHILFNPMHIFKTKNHSLKLCIFTLG